MPIIVKAEEVQQGATLLNAEDLVCFMVAAKSSGLPGARGRAHLNASTLFRWATKGVPDAHGIRHRLEAVRVGARWLTSTEAVRRLVAKLTEASLPADTPKPASPPPTPARRARAAQRASAEVGARLNS